MKCPFCGNTDLIVLESRSVDDENAIRRRRECEKCKKRFTTYEKVKNTFLWVIKKKGTREPFDREKVKKGILRAIHIRPVSLELIDEIIDQIERDMLNKEKEEVTSRAIGREILKKLKKIDKVAWLRFASVYLEFEDLDDFKKAIKN